MIQACSESPKHKSNKCKTQTWETSVFEENSFTLAVLFFFPRVGTSGVSQRGKAHTRGEVLP
eukprot:2781454-Amphidinium_carterae.1